MKCHLRMFSWESPHHYLLSPLWAYASSWSRWSPADLGPAQLLLMWPRWSGCCVFVSRRTFGSGISHSTSICTSLQPPAHRFSFCLAMCVTVTQCHIMLILCLYQGLKKGSRLLVLTAVKQSCKLHLFQRFHANPNAERNDWFLTLLCVSESSGGVINDGGMFNTPYMSALHTAHKSDLFV